MRRDKATRRVVSGGRWIILTGWILILILMGAGAAAEPGTLATGTSRIVGVAVAAETNHSIAGASVYCLSQNGAWPRVARTDEAGMFEFNELPGGRYVLEIEATGYLTSRTEVSLAEGQMENVRFVLKAATLNYGEIWGSVVDSETGAAIAQAEVQVRVTDATAYGSNTPGTTGSPEFYISTYTDEKGHYELRRVPVGTYEVRASHPEYYAGEKLTQVHAGLISLCNFKLVRRQSPATGAISLKVKDAVTGEPVVRANLTIDGIYTFAPLYTDENGEFAMEGLPVGPTAVHVYKEGYHPAHQEAVVESGQTTRIVVELEPVHPPDPGAVAGKVVDGVTEDPIAGVRIYYWPLALPTPAGALEEDTDPTIDSTTPYVTTGENGEYEIPGLGVGYYVLRTKAEGYFDQWERAEVLSGQVTTVNFRLVPEVPNEHGAIAGLVTDAETGEPVGGAVVYYGRDAVYPQMGWIESTDPALPHVRTNDDGRYEIPNLPAGVYFLLVRAEGFWPASGDARVAAGETTQVNFELKIFSEPEPGAIFGYVKDKKTSEPIAGALVYYAPILRNGTTTVAADGTVVDPVTGQICYEGDPSVLGGLCLGPYVRTNEDGFYAIDSLHPGWYAVSAHAEGYAPEHGAVEVVSDHEERLDFALTPRILPEKGAVAGKVTDAVTNEPIAGAFVFHAPFNADGTLPSWVNRLDPTDGAGVSPEEIRAPYTRTNERGEYDIPHLLPGAYIVLAYDPSYFPRWDDVHVEAGATSTLNFALEPIHTPLAAAIKGTVTDIVTGEPIAEAWVFYEAWLPNSTQGGGVVGEYAGFLPPYVRTDANGQYVISPLAAGVYRLRVTAEGYHPANQVTDVAWGETLILNFGLEPYVEPEPGVIEGVVVDKSTSHPIAGAWVYYGLLYADNGAPEWWSDTTVGISFEAPRVRTDENGVYRIGNLPPKTYHLLVQAEGYWPEDALVEVKSGEVSEANFALKPKVIPEPGAIVGRVQDSATSLGIAGAMVYYYRAYSPIETDPRSPDSTFGVLDPLTGAPTIAPSYVLTNEEGRYGIEDLEPGMYYLTVTKEGYYSQYRQVEVVSGQVSEEHFVLRPVETGIGAIHGRVIDALTTEPLAGVFVWVMPDGPIGILMNAAPLVLLGEARTDENGEYIIDGLPAGPVVVMAAMEGYRHGRRETTVLKDASVEVNFELQPIVEPKTGHLVGTVRDAANEGPITRALVVLIPEDGIEYALSSRLDLQNRTLTDENGHYGFRDVPVGKYRVLVTKEGYHPSKGETAIEENQTSELNFLMYRLEPPRFGALVGRVKDAATGEPIAGAVVRLSPNTWDEILAGTSAGGSAGDETVPDDDAALSNPNGHTVVTDERGRYVFERVLAGHYLVSVHARDYHPAHKKVEIEGGHEVRCNFALSPIPYFGVVEGVVSDALTNEPVENALVIVPNASAPQLSNFLNVPYARTNSSGEYRIARVPAGRRIVVALHPKYYEDAQVVHVEAGGTSHLDFALAPRLSSGFTWRVLAHFTWSGDPVEGVEIHVPFSDWIAPGSEWDSWSKTTDSSGSALIPDVPEGGATAIITLRGRHPVAVLLSGDLTRPQLAALIDPYPAYEKNRLSIIAFLIERADSGQAGRAGRRTGRIAPSDYVYQWKKNGVDLPGETGATLSSDLFDVDDAITCLVTYKPGTSEESSYETAPTVVGRAPKASVDSWWMLLE